MNIPSKDQIKKMVPKLQKILRLQDWNIDIEVLSDEEFVNLYERSEQGHNQITRLLNSSYITINKDITDDWYRTLVHELLHLDFDHLTTCQTLIYEINDKKVQQSVDDVFTVALERTVERMAEIFTTVYPITNLIKEECKNGNS